MCYTSTQKVAVSKEGGTRPLAFGEERFSLTKYANNNVRSPKVCSSQKCEINRIQKFGPHSRADQQVHENSISTACNGKNVGRNLVAKHRAREKYPACIVFIFIDRSSSSCQHMLMKEQKAGRKPRLAHITHRSSVFWMHAT